MKRLIEKYNNIINKLLESLDKVNIIDFVLQDKISIEIDKKVLIEMIEYIHNKNNYE
jgi:hypothetical protein